MRRVAVLTALLLLGLSGSAGAATLSLDSVGTFHIPTYVGAPADDIHRVFVVERAGTIQVLHDGVKHQFLDISSSVLCCDGERGLSSIAFPPDYATSGRFYVQYTAQNPVGAVTIAEYQRSASDADAADPLSGRVLLSIPHDLQTNHDGGQLQFGPDGYLYSGVGDGGSGGDPSGNGQNLTSSPPDVVNGVNHDPRLGKLLRIDPSSGSPYSDPASNPFPAPARDVFAYGLRNPWRFSFDRLTGNLAIADVGQGAYEEVDYATAPGNGIGANYGWSAYEGMHTYPDGTLVSPPFPAGYTFPVLERSHQADSVCSIIGGYVVRDPNLPELAGQYVYGDFCNPSIRAATLAPGGATGDHATGLSLGNITSFGEDACARVYVMSLDGPVYRISDGATTTCTTPVTPFPSDPTISVADAQASEGAGALTFTVSLSKATEHAVSVHYATGDGSAHAGSDYTATSGTLTFPAGTRSAQVRVPLAHDDADEADETLSLDLSNASGAAIADGHATGTIRDDDPAPALSIAGAQVREGDTGATDAVFAVTLSAPSELPVSAELATSDGTATAGRDYEATRRTVTFAPGQTSRTFTVRVLGDVVPERDETFAVTGGGASATGTILDDDPAVRALYAPRSARLGRLYCRGHAGCAGIRLRAVLGGAGSGRWRFSVRDGSRPGTIRLPTRAVRVAGATSRTLRLRLAPSGARYRAVRAMRHPVLRVMLSFTSAAGRFGRITRQVRLR